MSNIFGSTANGFLAPVPKDLKIIKEHTEEKSKNLLELVRKLFIVLNVFIKYIEALFGLLRLNRRFLRLLNLYILKRGF